MSWFDRAVARAGIDLKQREEEPVQGNDNSLVQGLLGKLSELGKGWGSNVEDVYNNSPMYADFRGVGEAWDKTDFKDPAGYYDNNTYAGSFGNAAIGNAAGVVGGVADLLGMEKLGNKMNDIVQGAHDSNEVEAGFNLDYITSPHGLVRSTGNVIGSMATIAPFTALVPEAAASTAATKLLQMAGRLGGNKGIQYLIDSGHPQLAKVFAERLGSYLPSGIAWGATSAPIESMAEGGGVVRQAKEAGLDNPYGRGWATAAENLPGLFLSNVGEGMVLRGAFKPAPGASALRRAASVPVTAGVESTQNAGEEAYQQIIQNLNTDRPLSEGVSNAALEGFFGSLLLGGAGGALHAVRNTMDADDTQEFKDWKQGAPKEQDYSNIDLSDIPMQDIEDAGLANTNNALKGQFRQLFDWANDSFGKQVEVSGGARSEEHNREVNGSPTSNHLHGNAIDVNVSMLTDDEREAFIQKAKEMGFNSDGDDFYHDRGTGYHVHLSYKGNGEQGARNAQREGHENAWAIYDVFKAAGYSDNAIAGILGRVQQEHNFDTSDVPEHEEEGMHLGGYGMFQWNGGRTTAFLNWAQENGLDPQSATTQAQYALLEAQQRGLTPEKMNQLSHEEAADLWTSDWEVGKPGDERKYAGEWLARLQNGGGVAGGTTPSTNNTKVPQVPTVDTYDDVYEQFAREQMETSTDAEEVDYFSGFFNNKGKFKDTPENRRKLDEDYGDQIREFAESTGQVRKPAPKAQPQETQIETQAENLDKLKAKLGKFKGRAIKHKDFNTATQINKAVQTNDVPAMQDLVNQLEGTQQAPSQNAPQPAQQTEQAPPIQVPAQANEAPQTDAQQTQEELLKRLQELNRQNGNTQNVINEFDDMQRQLEEKAGAQTGGSINGNTQSTQSTQTQPTESINTVNQGQNAEPGQAEEAQVNAPQGQPTADTQQAQQDTPQDAWWGQLKNIENKFDDLTQRYNDGKLSWKEYRDEHDAINRELSRHGATVDNSVHFNPDVAGNSRKIEAQNRLQRKFADEYDRVFDKEHPQQSQPAPTNEGTSAPTSTPVQAAPKKKSKALSQYKKNVAEVVDKYRNDETTYEKAFQKIADMQVAAEHVAPDDATVQEIRQVAEDGINQLNAIFAEKQRTPSQTAQEGAGEQETTAQVEEPTQEEKPAQSEAEPNEGGEKSAQNATVEENSTVANEEKLKKDYSSMTLDELKAERQKWIDEEVDRWKKNPGGQGTDNGYTYNDRGEINGRYGGSNNPDWYQWAHKRNGGKTPAKRDYPMFADEYLRNTQEYDELVQEIERREATKQEKPVEQTEQEKPTKKQESAEEKAPARESQFGDETENEKDFLEALGITEDETEEVSFGNEFGDTTDEEIEALKKELQKEFSKLSANPVFNPRIYTLGLQLGGKYIQKGYRTFKKWLEKMTSDLGENIEPWAPAIWETLKTYPKGQKFDPKQVMACSKLIGSKFERGVTSLEDVNADMKKLLKGRYKEFAPMIEASYNGIEKYFSTIKEGENNVNDSTRGLASRTGEGVNKDSVGRNDESGRPSRGSKREGRQEAESDIQQQDSAGIYDSSPSRSGKAGNSGVQAEESADRSGGTRDTELSGSVRDSYEGSVALDDGRKAEDINPAEERPVNAADKEVSKAKENTTYKAGDLDSIKADLPMLRPEQQEDVQRIEKRLLVDKGQGFLCTNGTGTGKTYSGLGVIKRAYDQGKKNILVVAPKAEIIKQWIEAAKTDFSLDIKQLSDTKDNGGKGICITTYANFQANRELAARDWDMIVADESHTLLENKDASETSALKMLRSLTEHPRQLYNRWKLKNRTKKIRALENKLDEYESKLAKLAADHNKHKVSDSVYGERSASLKDNIKQTENAIAEEYRSMNDQWKEVEKQWKAIPSEDKPKVLFMSATPFAYDKSIDYAEGYLFNYNEDTNPGSYHNQSGFEQFMIQKFGYRFRYGKLAKPEAQVDNRVMEIQFHDDLVDAGVMYGRQIDLPVDYDRGFLLVDGGIGNKIDEGFKFLWDNNKKYGKLADALRKQFDTRAKRYLIESIKAKAVVPIVQEYIKSGKKVVLFHQSMREKLNVHPFQLKTFSDRQVTEQWELFKKERPDLVAMRFDDIPAPMTTLKSAFKDALYLDGSQEHKKSRNNAVKLFQDDDSGKNLIICQQDAANAGVSLHDTTGKHQRVLINIATPERPIYAMQIEGRIYRVGSVTNAIFRYLSTGTELEKSIFANTIGSRAETTENLALGVDARGLQDSFTNLFMETLDDSWERRKPGHPEEGTGGKEMDFSGKSDVTLWERAKSFYYGQQKKNSSTKAKEGNDYFATPEPIGLKMVEWLGLKNGDSALEPSAGHGAISRWFSPNTNNTIVEPSGKLAPLAQMVTPNAKVVQDNFENFNVVNKFDGIAMNPPFGQGGKTAVDHIAKAFRHLKDGGRMVAILPVGPSANAHFNKWLYGENKNGEQVQEPAKGAFLTANILLPSVTFNRAGTGVATKIVVIDKMTKAQLENPAGNEYSYKDLTGITDINELFDRMENMTVPERVKPKTTQNRTKNTNIKQYVLPAETTKGGKTSYAAVVNDAEGVTSDDVKDLATTYRGKYISETDSFAFDFKEERNDFVRAANDLLAKSKNPPELRDSYKGEIDGTPITIHSDGRITGKTYGIKDTIKENGGKWDRDSSVWRINDPAKLTKFINKYNTEGVQVDEQEEDTSTAFNVKESDGQYIANVKDKLEYDTYKDVLKHAKKHGGDYKKGKGFVFDNEADLNEFVEVADALLGMGDAKYSITAWHGTAATGIDRLSLQYIGTGEGAQVHGWGLYFAEDRKVGEEYRDRLTREEDILLRGKVIDIYSDDDWEQLSKPEQIAAVVLEQYADTGGASTAELVEGIKEEGKSEPEDAVNKAIELVKSGEIAYKRKSPGSLFQVEIPDEDLMLDEQKPFSEQPEKVKKALRNLINETAFASKEIIEMFGGKDYGKDQVKRTIEQDYSGRQIYKTLSALLSKGGVRGDKNASVLLNKYGVKGITYIGGRDSRCYVVFDDEAIEIIARFSKGKEKLRNLLRSMTFPKDSELTSQEQEIVNFGKQLGVKVVWFDGNPNLHGFHQNNITFLNRRSVKDVQTTFYHETFHWLKNNNPAFYQELLASIEKAGVFTQEQLDAYREKTGRYDLSNSDAIEEMLADEFIKPASRHEVLGNLAKQNKSVVERLIAWMKRVVDRIASVFHNPQGKLTTAQRDAFVKSFNKMAASLRDQNGRQIFTVNRNEITLQNGKPLASQEVPNTSDEVKFSADLSDSEKSFLDKASDTLAKKMGIKPTSDQIKVDEKAPRDKGFKPVTDYIVSSPSRIAERSKAFKLFYNMADKAMNLLTKNRTEFSRKFDKAWSLCKSQDERNKLNEVLVAGDAEEKEFTKDEIMAMGGSENVAEAYKQIRRLIRKAYNLVNEARKRPTPHSRRLTNDEINKLRENPFVEIQKISDAEDGKKLVTYKEYANWTKEYDVTPEELQQFENDNAIQILEQDENEDGTIHLKVREGISDLANKKGYIPHIFHEYMVRVKDKDGNVVDDYGYGGVLASGRNESEAIAKAEEWLKNNKLKDGETIHVAPKVFSFQSLGMDEGQYAAVMGDRDFDMMVKGIADHNEMTLAEAKEVVKGSAKKKNRHRFFGHTLQRHGANGFEQDMRWALSHYFNSAARYHAMETEFKPQAISLFERLFGDFDKKHTGLAKYVQDYISDINGNPSELEQTINEFLNQSAVWRKLVVSRYGDRAALRAVNSITRTMSYLCLGFLNTSSALLNFSQTINAAAYLGNAKYAPMIVAKGMKRRYSPQELRVLVETNVGNDVGLDSGSGYDKMRSVGGLLNAIGDKGMILFKKSEQACRFGTTLVAYNKARAEGKSHDEAIAYAKEINRKSNFDYSVADAPNIFRRGSVISQVALQFKKYGIKEMEVVADMFPTSTKSTKAQKAIFWGMYLLTAGLLQVPLFDWWDKLFGGKDKIQKYIMEATGDSPLARQLAITAMYGLAANAGVDMSRRVGLADVIPSEGKNLVPPAINKPISFAQDMAAGNYANAVRDVSPGLYNQYAAWVAGASEGSRGRTNGVYDDMYSKMLRAAGFTSTDERIASDIQRITYNQKDEKAKEKQKAIDEFIDNPTNENAKRLKELGVKPSTVKKERERKKRSKLDRIKVDMSKEEMKRNKDLFRFAE